MSKTAILRIILAIAILVGGATAYLGWKVKADKKSAEQAKKDAEERKDKAENDLKSSQGKEKKATDDLQIAQASLQTVQKETEAIKKKADENTAELEKTKQELAHIASDAKAAQSKLEQIKSVLPPGVEPDKIAQEMKKLQDTLTALNEEKQVIGAKLAELEKENTNYKKRLENRASGQVPKDLVGHVMAINTEWNFVVLDIGENDGIVPNAYMLIYREGQLLGRIKITSVEPSISIGDILPKWTHGELREGDSAIAAETANGL